jgi:hypothetical protein
MFEIRHGKSYENYRPILICLHMGCICVVNQSQTHELEVLYSNTPSHHQIPIHFKTLW